MRKAIIKRRNKIQLASVQKDRKQNIERMEENNCRTEAK